MVAAEEHRDGGPGPGGSPQCRQGHGSGRGASGRPWMRGPGLGRLSRATWLDRRRHQRLGPVVVPVLASLGLAVACVSPNPDALWDIVHGACVPNMQAHGDPAPCAMVALQDGIGRGYAALKDLRGVAQYLLIPTARVSGIEDPALLAPGAPNYFAAAWRIRHLVDARLGRRLPRDGVSLAINSAYGRTQNQFHIHVDCIRADVRDALRIQAADIGDRWMPLPVPLGGWRYRARRVLGADLGPADPFVLLAEGVPGARQEMGRHTLVVVGAAFAGSPGFVLLDHRADLAAGDRASGEELQDHGCALAGEQAEGPSPPYRGGPERAAAGREAATALQAAGRAW